MKTLILIISLIFLTNCSSNSVVKLGKKCTKMAHDNSYEKSFVWIVDKKNIEDFKQIFYSPTLDLECVGMWFRFLLDIFCGLSLMPSW